MGVDGSRAEYVLEQAHIATNKNTVPGDRSALVPSGIRMGTPALTSRGLVEADFDVVADFFARGIDIAADIKAGLPSKKLKDFKLHLNEGASAEPALVDLRAEVSEFASQFPTVGF